MFINLLNLYICLNITINLALIIKEILQGTKASISTGRHEALLDHVSLKNIVM